MSLKKGLVGGLGLSLLLASFQPAAKAQSVEDVTFEVTPVAVGTAEELANLESAEFLPAQTPATEAPQEIAQARRRTRNLGNPSNNFVGIGADFGYADDVSFAVISKLAVNESVSVRPSVLIGDDFSILVPVTYDFPGFSTNVSNFSVRPYAGVGAAYSDGDDDDDFNLLLTAGADVPISRRFTLNAQANLGVLNDTDFGVTVGVGYNLGRLFR